MSLAIATLGTPRIGPRRELKFALEAYWSGRIGRAELLETAAALRAANWADQAARGVAVIPSNDFSFYDQMLDTAVMVGAVPAGYGWTDGMVSLDSYFAMARGVGGEDCACGHPGHGGGVPALEMTKWFDTNYHYLVPELGPGQRFVLASTKPVDEFREAKAFGIHTRPVLVGPVTFLRLAKGAAGFDRLTLIDRLLPVYVDVLKLLAANGADWVQMDEPVLATDIDAAARAALIRAYGLIASAVPNLKVMLTSYFGPLGDNLDLAVSLPTAGLHLDLMRGRDDLAEIGGRIPDGKVLSLGVIDGRNVWRADLDACLDLLRPIVARRGFDHIQLAPSCSLLHVPHDVEAETGLDPDIRSWLAFARQKMDELAVLGRALESGSDAVADALAATRAARASRLSSRRVVRSDVRARLAAVTLALAERPAPFAERAALQRQRFGLPPFPTTTIGSFPQTQDVRRARQALAKGAISEADYRDFLKTETAACVRWQEEIGLDVLVHGEFERNDMVQYFGEKLDGFAFTQHGWVQSYGSRCVRPPILYGDVARPEPMTVDWWRHAQSLTDKPMKAMLTGPVTILNWSFVRDDIGRDAACRQIALALRDEVADLEDAGAAMIQIDEAALREGLPIRKADRARYLDWAVESFRLTSSGVGNATQIHTHMCYSEFNDIIASIAAMDADVISIECSRSKMELLTAFADFHYPNDIGPGVYDIHSPRVPSVEEMAGLIRTALGHLPAERIWINPDCGLKTRGWPEVQAALANMVAAARDLRQATTR
ncbi:5-methyltetrahydropteroyltriglutamate--homocysteine S-methyltransferase [Pleomorphomonas carboxyditropha]|uniref:5-methyltetrahydropteroyltriglutamate--homocysteine methyltransferase n=1 Tax=Pleomorphomonas carboxyditropha TaxID=2023338 RepID=A0A2G9WQ22_9HYPH|nr:5-methyltetrahydropteroyltriglutamate--homocysteine S-methyltransferase [Pleomorphomonas carboxyditropha]PIO96745.1 5-methyltetrahydropteroyltriglutamate--homocysteine S-methyltransferase [Pleomorphomonas carboxyditropha]